MSDPAARRATDREVVLVSNGPGELLTWTKPVLDALRARDPDVAIRIALIPCQFASGREAEIAATFGADAVTTPAQFARSVPTGRAPAGLGAARGVVLQLGGGVQHAAALAARLGHPLHRYAFTAHRHRRVVRLYVPDARTARRAVRRGTPAARVEVAGNLVADVLQDTPPAPDAGAPHLLVMPGSRDAFARVLIPLFLAVVDALAPTRPDARFVWPVSRMLSDAAIRDGVAGVEKDVLGGVAGRRNGDVVVTPSGARVEMVPETARHPHLRAADLALTIPGTNTLELGVAGVPALVVLPMNAPERIPLEGAGHWLGLLPWIGPPLKRAAVRTFVERLDQPVSLPNRIADDAPFEEVAGLVDACDLARRLDALLADAGDLAHRRARLAATMPRPGAAGIVADRVLAALGGPA
ncbi:MAG: hypothetical protein RI554_03080 [Trueperaceae bacterium]|nr:hypothetical protein [Trueperaceae bacterium]